MKNKHKHFSRLFLKNSIIIFICLISSILFLLCSAIISYKTGILSGQGRTPIIVLVFLIVTSIILGIILSVLGANKITKPINKLKNATNEIAKGNFDIVLEQEKMPEINELIENFNKMARELKHNETLKTDFISNVSHEFKTPLSVIAAYSKSLRRDDLTIETRKKYEEVLDSNIKKLSMLTSNILMLSKVENQEIMLDKTEFLIDEQIRKSILELEPEWKRKNIDFELMLPKTKYYGNADVTSQIWQNLIGNAIKFSNPNSNISIYLTSNYETITIRIIDRGIGMNEETLAHIYDKFYQGDISHSAEGNGLGLALVSRILKISDGKIDVKSKLNEGTTFIVTLKNNIKL